MKTFEQIQKEADKNKMVVRQRHGSFGETIYQVRKENKNAFASSLIELIEIINNSEHECWQEFNIHMHGTLDEIRIYWRQFRESL